MSIEIKNRIDYLNDILENIVPIDNFALNQKVRNTLYEIEELQRQCQHEFKNGSCIYCYIEEPH